MIQFIPTIKAGATLATLSIGGGLATMLAEVNIGDSTTIQIGLVGGLVVGVFFAGCTLQKLKDGQRAANKRLSRIERKLQIEEDEDARVDTD